MIWRLTILMLVGLAAVSLPAATSKPASAPASRPTVVAVLPLAIDFKDDSGTDEDFGQRVAFAVAKKWGGLKGYEALDRFTVEEAMTAAGVKRGADIKRDALAELVRKKLAADVAVFGSASGAGAAKTIRLCVIDYRDAEGVWPGRVALDKTYKMAYWTDLRFLLEDAIASVAGVDFAHASEQLAILDPASVEQWKKNPNLVPNGEFAKGQAGKLSQWEGVVQAKRYNPAWTEQAKAALQEDMEKMILWSPSFSREPQASAPSGTASSRPVLQMAMPESIAATNGLACYSDWIEVKPGNRYRCQITYASQGPTFLPFVKGYAPIETPGEAQPQRREVYRRQFPKLPSTGGEWKTAVVDFVPAVLPPSYEGQRKAYELRWVRVDLYCYWPAGHVWVRDVTLKLVEEPAPGRRTLDPMTPTTENGRAR